MMKLMMIPGWGCTTETWGPVLKAFGQEIVTSVLPWEHCLNNLHADLLPKDEQVILLGWSLGGMAALQLASAFPDRVAGLVLVATSLTFCGSDSFPGTSPRALKAMRLRLKRQREATLLDFAALSAPHSVCHSSQSNRAPEPFTETFLAMSAEFKTETLSHGLDYLATTDLMGTKLSQPMVVLHGEEDRVIPIAAGTFLAHNFAAEFHSLPGLGHNLPWTAPANIANAYEALQHRLKEQKTL